MANTRQSAKRARQNEKRKARNAIIRTSTRTAVKTAVESLKKGAAAGASAVSPKDAYLAAIKTLAKASSKGAIPHRRAARKIGRLTRLLNASKPAKAAATASAK